MIKCIVCTIAFMMNSLSGISQTSNTLWYDAPAEHWVEALPVGNGKIGAMVFGKVQDELIQLNESTLWSGGPRKSGVNPGAYQYLHPIREALAAKNYSLANDLTRKMQGHYSESFLPLGDLHIKQHFVGDGEVEDYSRKLDIGSALSTVKYRKDGVQYEREIFVSNPANVMAVRIKSDKARMLNLHFALSSQLRGQTAADDSHNLSFSGKAPARVDPSYYNQEGRNPILWDDTTGCNGMRFNSRLSIASTDGKVTATSEGIEVKEASEVVLYFTAATSFNGFDKCPDRDGKNEKELTSKYLSSAQKLRYKKLKEAHVKDYRSLFDRLTFDLVSDKSEKDLSLIASNDRLKRYSQGNKDLELERFFLQYGRYLLISSSRAGGAPANLQGIWNKELRAPWSSNYTININTQMNYWPAEMGNLSELHTPLLQFIENLSVTGKSTAEEYYRTRGWVAHHNSDIWALSNAVGDIGGGDPLWANWYMGGAWLSRHLWERYAFSMDKSYLKDRAYPVMKEAALFCVDWLIERDGLLVTSPSTTPENLFIYEGKRVAVSEGTTMDMAIIRDLFHHVITAAEILDVDEQFRDTLSKKMSLLSPYKIGSQGQLLEWSEEYVEEDPHHRHLSHLYGVHPGIDISPLKTPALAAAASKSFAIRGDEGTGWSKAWKINFAARLHEGDHAYKMVREILRYCDPNDRGTGGTYPNFFDAHPPFQIDGNFGASAGMMEMLVQSHLGEIHLLPALPTAWNAGQISGIKARGNFELDIIWADAQLVSGKVKSLAGETCILRTKTPIRIKGARPVMRQEDEYFVYEFPTKTNKVYHISKTKLKSTN